MASLEKTYIQEGISLLERLIATPSFSRQEEGTASLIGHFFTEKGIPYQRSHHNLWAVNKHFSPQKPTVLLNSHHDTVKPGSNWTYDPFSPTWEGNRLYGLGSNDAGGCLVSLIVVFLHFYSKKSLPVNFILAATAEEEISGPNGIASLIPSLGSIDMGIVGEPTQMDIAIAEKGLMVLDCTARGKTGHAARDEGVNAIYQALADIQWFQTFEFPQTSEWLGEVKMTVTQIEAGTQHNVVPDACTFVVDVRTTDQYSNREALDIIESHIKSEVVPRSLRLNPSGITMDHPLILSGLKLGLSCFGSPTLSDQALLNIPTIKIGPGDSARSHTPDEFIQREEIERGIQLYIELLEGLSLS